MKDYNHIEELLERYYNAQTSEAEEKRLKDFFLNEEIPAHLQAERDFFLQLQELSIPEGLEERLAQSINQWEVKERNAIKKHHSNRLLWIGSIAASLLFLFGTSWYFQDPPRKDTCATPEEAYAEAQKALIMFSTALNKGMKQIDVLHETTERIEQIFINNEPL